MILKDKNIILAISGGIAAYKTVELASQLKKLGASVHAVCTENAYKFVSKLSLQTMTGHKVYDQQFDLESPEIDHIALAEKADLVLIAPATANLIGKIANGISDNLITDLCLVTKAPVLIAPAMNTNMWEHKSVQKNISYLEDELGYEIIEPDHGDLACGYHGQGRLAEFEKIIDRVCLALGKKANPLLLTKEFLPAIKMFNGKKVVVTAGGTREAIDPVRFIGNRSSGKMGFALADAAFYQGAEVVLITTIPVDKPYKTILVETADEMKNIIEKEFPDADILIMTAAVADYKPAIVSSQKLKKQNHNINLELTENADILKNISKNKRDDQYLVGFALESENLIDNATKKLKSKNLDMIVANDVKAFNDDNNEVFLISKEKNKIAASGSTGRQPKDKIASIILDEIEKSMKRKQPTKSSQKEVSR